MGTFIGLTLFGMNGIMVIVAIAGAVAIGAFLFRKDTAIEQQRMGAIDSAREFDNEGVPVLPDILSMYAVGDYSGIMSKIKETRSAMRNPEQRRAVFQTFLKTQLERAMKDPERRQHVMQAVDEYRAAEKVKADEVFAAESAKRSAAV